MPNKENEEIKIGVYTCFCGGNISDVVNCELVSEQFTKLPNVVVSRTNMAMCSDIGQSLIEEDIKENAKDTLQEIIKKVTGHPNIIIYTQSQVKNVTGYVDDFRVRSNRTPEVWMTQTAI
jgi:heterodisulfide reductase subunit A-like polyferredoxin